MSNFLEDIVAHRRSAVEKCKQLVTEAEWQMMPLFGKQCRSLKQALLNKSNHAIIAEFKRASPSKGTINDGAAAMQVLAGYQEHGAAGVSVLTEPLFFKGSNDDLIGAASTLTIPVLRKDFILEEYQLVETKALGADVVLLIAAVLTKAESRRLARLARQLGMEVLLEIHNESELAWINEDTDIVGVNNRNLKTFEVDINTSLELSKQIPADTIKISESGIDDVRTIKLLKQHGFLGFLVGERFMKDENPGEAFKNFVSGLRPVD